MRLKIKDEVYELDVDHITIGEARTLKKHSDMGVHEIFFGLRRGDPDAVASLVFLALMRAGKNPRWHDLDELDLVDDVVLLDEEVDDDDHRDGGAEPDPTSAGGTTRTPGSSATSPRSRSSTTSHRGRSTS